MIDLNQQTQLKYMNALILQVNNKIYFNLYKFLSINFFIIKLFILFYLIFQKNTEIVELSQEITIIKNQNLKNKDILKSKIIEVIF